MNVFRYSDVIVKRSATREGNYANHREEETTVTETENAVRSHS